MISDNVKKEIDRLLAIPRDTHDPLILELIAERFDQFNIKSAIWPSAENICMKIHHLKT